MPPRRRVLRITADSVAAESITATICGSRVSHAPSESEGDRPMCLQANQGILPHIDLKPENAEQRFHPMKLRVTTFQFVTPTDGASILFGLWFYNDAAPTALILS